MDGGQAQQSRATYDNVTHTAIRSHYQHVMTDTAAFDRWPVLKCRINGKLFSELSMQMKYMAQYYYYYGGLADKVEDSVISTDKPNVFNYTQYEPIGVVACIMPWNSPLPLTSLKLAPALAVGTTVVLKPSEFTSASLLEFVKLVELAGFPPGVVNVVTGCGAVVGDALVTHPEVERIAVTGGGRIPDA